MAYKEDIESIIHNDVLGLIEEGVLVGILCLVH